MVQVFDEAGEMWVVRSPGRTPRGCLKIICLLKIRKPRSLGGILELMPPDPLWWGHITLEGRGDFSDPTASWNKVWEQGVLGFALPAQMGSNRSGGRCSPHKAGTAPDLPSPDPIHLIYSGPSHQGWNLEGKRGRYHSNHLLPWDLQTPIMILLWCTALGSTWRLQNSRLEGDCQTCCVWSMWGFIYLFLIQGNF